MPKILETITRDERQVSIFGAGHTEELKVAPKPRMACRERLRRVASLRAQVEELYSCITKYDHLSSVVDQFAAEAIKLEEEIDNLLEGYGT